MREQQESRGKSGEDLHPRLRLLREVIEERGFTLATVAGEMSPPRHRSWLSKALKGQRRLHDDDFDQILAIVGLPRFQFYQRFLVVLGGKKSRNLVNRDPATLLLSFDDGDEIELPDPIAQLIHVELPSMQHDPLRRLPPRLQELDEIRLSDPQHAKGECLKWITRLWAEITERGYHPGLLAEILVALGVFATISRTLGDIRIATRVLAFALKQTRAVSGLVLASLLWRASPMLTDNGYPDQSVAALERAVGIFAIHQQRFEVAVAQLSLGLQHLALGGFDRAILCFEYCLAEPEARNHHRSMALANIALVYERQRQPEKAITLLESLTDVLAAAAPAVRANVRWIKARALASSDDLDRAAELFAGLQSDIGHYGAPADPLLLFCDYAVVLTRMGDRRRLTAAAELLHEQIGDLDLPAAMFRLAHNMLEEACHGRLRVDEWRRWRGRLAQKAKRQSLGS